MLDVSASITFHNIPCAALDLNALDSKQTNLFGGGHKIFKTRLDQQGNRISRNGRTAPKIREGFREVSDTNVIFWTAMKGGHWARAQTAGMRLRCPPCFSNSFQPGVVEDECCHSCDDLKQRGVRVSLDGEWIPEQCLADQMYDTTFPPQDGEGCRFDVDTSLAKLTVFQK